MPDTTTLLLAPILLIQGKWLRWKLPKLDEAAGARQGRQGNGQALSLVIFGDSAAAGVGVKQQQHALLGQLIEQLNSHYQVDWQLTAQSGLKTGESLELLKSVPKQKADVVVLSLGVNDAKSTGSPRRWLLELEQVVDQIRVQLNPSLISIAKVPPMGKFNRFPQPLRGWLGWRAGLFNQQLTDWANHHSDIVLTEIPAEGADLAIDGLHPGPATYRLWAIETSKQIGALLRT